MGWPDFLLSTLVLAIVVIAGGWFIQWRSRRLAYLLRRHFWPTPIHSLNRKLLGVVDDGSPA
jgi:hypothetical protein